MEGAGFTAALTRAHYPVLSIGLLLLVCLFSYRSIHDLDYGIHVATGRWILEKGRVPTTDPFSWSYSHHEYIAYHWGFQALLAYCDSLFGTLGVVGLRSILLILAALALAGTLFMRKANPLVALWCALIGLIIAEWRFSVRPELFTNLGLALTVFLLELRRRGSKVALYFLPVTFLVWINTHIYILGLVILGCELVVQCVQRKLDRGLIRATVASILVLFVNPYGVDAVLEPVRLFSRLQDANIFAQHISELSSPFTVTEDTRQINSVNASRVGWFVLLSLTPISAYYLYRARRMQDLLVLAVFGVLSTAAIRNLSLLVFAGLPALVTGLSFAATAIPQRFQRYDRFVKLAFLCTLCVLTVRVGTGAWYASSRVSLHLKPIVERTALAVEAATFIRERGLIGRGFNNFNIGGTLMLYAPDHPVYIDGRNEVTGEEFFRRYLEVLQPAVFEKFAEQAHIEYVALSHREMMPLIRVLANSPKWRVVHYDSVAIVLVRTSGPNGQLPEAFLPRALESEQVRWSGLHSIMTRPSYVDTLSRWFLGTEELSYEKSQTGVFLLTLGKWREAEPILLQAAIESPNYWEASNNLGALYTRLKDWEATAFAYRTVLMLNPDDPLARRRASESWANFLASERVRR